MATLHKIMYVNVSIATLWSEPHLDRPIDEPSITNPVHPWKWTRSMTLDEKLWLVGKLETQALLGNKVTIVDSQNDWSKIIVHDQPTPNDLEGYPGWVPSKQLIYHPTFDEMNSHPFVLITKPTVLLYSNPPLNKEYMEVSFNTRLPLLGESDHYKVLLPNGTSAWMRKEDGKAYDKTEEISTPTGDDIVKTATQFLGLPYLWGGTGGFGFDCSGFAFSIYQRHGIHIPRDAAPQSQTGVSVPKKSLQKGDLVFFANQNSRINHVTMYVGNRQMIHAPESAKTIEIISIDTPSYLKTFAGARRYLA